MSTIDSNHLHSDPGIEGHTPEHGDDARANPSGLGVGGATPMQRDAATTIFA